MDAAKILAQRTKMKVIDLRTKASRRTSLDDEHYRLFKEIEEDPKCNWILRDSSRVEKKPKGVEYYNKHIRQSKLSAKDKKELII